MNILQIIKNMINTFTIVSVGTMYFFPSLTGLYWDISLIAVIILMILRPLADITESQTLRQYVSLRKQLGILSSAIVVMFGLIHYIPSGLDFFPLYFSLSYWSLSGDLLWAHLGELTGFILLITSNMMSMRILKRNWKRVQRLSYVYFLTGSWYVFSQFGKTYALMGIILVLELTIWAYIIKKVPDETTTATGAL